MTIDEILSRFPDARETAGGWSARCPAHEDRRASLSIGIGEKENVLLHCHAGCETSAILDKLGLTMKDLMPSTGNGKPRILGTYDYRDADGTLLYQVCRYAPKDFRRRARSPAADGPGRSKASSGFPTVCRNCLRPIREQSVFIVEGEKDADRLHRHGLMATSNAGGAGKWVKDFARYFADRHVVILPDNDAARPRPRARCGKKIIRHGSKHQDHRIAGTAGKRRRYGLVGRRPRHRRTAIHRQ